MAQGTMSAQEKAKLTAALARPGFQGMTPPPAVPSNFERVGSTASADPSRVSGRETKGQTSKYKGGRKSRKSRRISRKKRLTRRR